MVLRKFGLVFSGKRLDKRSQRVSDSIFSIPLLAPYGFHVMRGGGSLGGGFMSMTVMFTITHRNARPPHFWATFSEHNLITDFLLSLIEECRSYGL